MKKEVKKEGICKDCVYCIPDMTNVSYNQTPIMGTCEHEYHKFLINHHRCKNFERWKN